jgi:hypothetical protein
VPRVVSKIKFAVYALRFRLRKEDSEVTPLLIELLEALHEHIEQMRTTLNIYPFVVERRAEIGPR